MTREAASRSPIRRHLAAHSTLASDQENLTGSLSWRFRMAWETKRTLLAPFLFLCLAGSVFGLAVSDRIKLANVDQAIQTLTVQGNGMIDGLLEWIAPNAKVAQQAAKAPQTPAPAPEQLQRTAGLERDIKCLAQNIYFEARNEPRWGQIAVAHVVLNRVASSRFPDSICQVVYQGGRARHRCQFSWYCDGKSETIKNPAAWERSVKLAEKVYRGTVSDPTGNALWYHADYVSPYWRHDFWQGPTIGRHIFYRVKPKNPTATRVALN